MSHPLALGRLFNPSLLPCLSLTFVGLLVSLVLQMAVSHVFHSSVKQKFLDEQGPEGQEEPNKTKTLGNQPN